MNSSLRWWVDYDYHVYIDGFTPAYLTRILAPSNGSSCSRIPRWRHTLIMDVG